MKRFKLYNNIVGWLAFAIATVTYLPTIEPTASFWDCGEFIASSYKLEVGHPPGNPTWQILVRLFTLFVAPEHVAAAINSSVVCPWADTTITTSTPCRARATARRAASATSSSVAPGRP